MRAPPGALIRSMKRYLKTERSQVVTTTWYMLQGGDGVVQLMVMHCRMDNQWFALDLGIHSRVPLFEGHKKMQCEFFGGECYFSPSFGLATELWDKAQSSDDPMGTIWSRLEDVYFTLYNDQG